EILAESRATRLDLTIGFKHFPDAVGEPHERIDRKAPIAQRLVHPPLRVRRQALHVAPDIGEEAERAPGGERWIELPHETRCGVARIGKDLEALFRLLAIQFLEVGM